MVRELPTIVRGTLNQYSNTTVHRNEKAVRPDDNSLCTTVLYGEKSGIPRAIPHVGTVSMIEDFVRHSAINSFSNQIYCQFSEQSHIVPFRRSQQFAKTPVSCPKTCRRRRVSEIFKTAGEATDFTLLKLR